MSQLFTHWSDWMFVPAAHEDRRSPVVRGREGQHRVTGAGGIGAHGIGDVLERVVEVIVIIEDVRCPVELEEKVAGWQKVGDGVEVGWQGIGKEREVYGVASVGEELVGWVIVTSAVHEAAKLIATNL